MIYPQSHSQCEPFGTNSPALSPSPKFSGKASLEERALPSLLLGSLLGLSADLTEEKESRLGQRGGRHPTEIRDQGAQRRCTCPSRVHARVARPREKRRLARYRPHPGRFMAGQRAQPRVLPTPGCGSRPRARPCCASAGAFGSGPLCPVRSFHLLWCEVPGAGQAGH